MLHIVLVLSFFSDLAVAQSRIRGVVLSSSENALLDSAAVKVVNRDLVFLCDLNGQFEIEVFKDDLLEFSRRGYRTERLRIQNENLPKQYSIHLQKVKSSKESRSAKLLFQLDSINFDQTYFTQMNGARKGERHSCPGTSLSAMSNKNQKKWAFQALFKKWQNEKYVDFIFNSETVKKIANLSGDDLAKFMNAYRPTEDFLRTATQYELLEYIKKSYRKFSMEQKY